MRLSNKYILAFRNITFTVCFVFWAFNGAQAQTPQTPDINKIWTTVGSAGTVDESDLSKVFLDHGVVQMGRPQPGSVLTSRKARQKRTLIQLLAQSAVIRYNITPVEGLFAVKSPCQTGTGTECPCIELKLRYLATGGSSRVIAKLIEVDLATGAEVPRLTFDSKDFPAANNYQVQSVSLCGPPTPPRFDFEHKAYYIEATLTGGLIFGAGAAGIQVIKVANTSRIG